MKCLYCKKLIEYPNKLCVSCRTNSLTERKKRACERSKKDYKINKENWNKLSEQEKLNIMLQFTKEYMRKEKNQKKL